MNEYVIWYLPMWGQLTRRSKHIKAVSERHAEMKFFATDAGRNCQRIFQIEKIKERS